MQAEDLHNVTDDEYILIIIAGRFTIHYYIKEIEKEGEEGERNKVVSLDIISDGFPILSTYSTRSVVSHRTKNYCYCCDKNKHLSINRGKPGKSQ